MTTPIQSSHSIRGLFVRALVLGSLVLGAMAVPLFAGQQRAFAAGSVSDNFNRANGTLGAGWTDMSDGGMAISSQVVVGTKSSYSGDIRTGETYLSNQSSQIEVTSTQLSGGQWIGAAVRAQNAGQNLYLRLYFWNNGNPELMLFKRISGSFTQLGSSSFQGALAAGTQLNLSVSGSTLTFSQNGVARITATDTSLTGGAPGIMAYGAPTGDNWVGTGTSGPTYTVGGTIAGLTGTAVLENNAGNDLSTSTNGAFTFSTALAAGAAYNVTVKTNPSGQLYTVTNPSGTIAAANVTNVSISCVTQTAGGSVSDNFNRANGTLGAGWTDMSDGGMAISSQVVVGTKSSYSGDIRTGETYLSNQSSQIEVTSTQLSGGQWIGAAVRAQNAGQNLYLRLYFWNNGNPELMLFKRISGSFTQLGSSSFQGALAAGTQLNLSVSGSTLTFSQNGVARITATDTSLTGGAPGIMAYGAPTGDNWVGTGTSGPTYTVGGTIAGLTGTAVLENNAGNDLSTSTNGAFTFSTALAAGAAYNVTVKTNPSGQLYTVTNPSGTIAAANVTNVSISCVTQTAGGSVSDNFNRANGTLGAGWTDMSDGGMAISSQVVVGTKSSYSGDIRTGETYLSNQSSQIEVTSTQLSGGQWIGAAVLAQKAGRELYLGLYFWNNGNPELMLFKRISGSFTQLGSSSFQGALAAGTQLNLSVSGSTLTFSQNGVARITATDTSLTGGAPAIMAYGAPTGDNWVGTGTSGPPYTVGGTIAGLTGTAVLENNAGNDLSTSTNGAFTFSTALAAGAAYNVTVKTNPSGQLCTVTNPSGTIAAANVTNVSISCVTQVAPTYTVGGTIAGLTGTAVLENNAGNDLSTSTNGAFTFSTALAAGAAYNVTVKTNPSGQLCTVTNPSGTIAAANVTNVSISCVTQVAPTYTVGGTIAGLTGTAVLENNAGNDLSTSTNGAFTFSTALAAGAAYNVTVKTNPSGQLCTVTNPSGTIAAANVTNVSISCVTQVAPTYTVGGTIAGLTGTAVLEN